MKQQFDFRTAWLVSAIAIAAMLAMSFWAWSQVPAGTEVPVHWNANGEVDRYGSIWEGILLMPAVSIGLVALLTFIPRLEPRKGNLMQSQKAYLAVWYAVIAFMTGIHGTIIFSTLGYQVNIITFISLAMGLLFIVLGNFMGKVRSNFIFGVRTPWTLSSELSWNKTHRLAGKLFIAYGLITIVAGFFLSIELWLGVTMGLVFLKLIVVMGYSYVVWRDDPAVARG